MSTPTDRLLYTKVEAAHLLSISPRHIDNLVQSGELDSVKLGRKRLVERSAIEAYIERLKAAS